MSDNFVDIDLLNLRQGMDALYKAVESIATRDPKEPTILFRSLSGDHIHGGKITDFQSVGIKDNSSKMSLIVSDRGISTKTIKTEALLGDTVVKGNLNVDGEITATKLHVNEITADVRLERSTPLVFVAEGDAGVYGKGIHWAGQGPTKQLIYRESPDRIWSSESIDLHDEAYYAISGIPVVTKKELGSSIRTSSLVTVGTLRNLKTQGNLTVDDYVFYESSTQRIGIGTDNPNGNISIASLDAEFIINVDSRTSKIGNWTTNDLEIVTDNTARIKISSLGNITIGSSTENKTHVVGKLGVNVKNPDCDISTAGPVKFQGKRQEVGDTIPVTGSYNIGDIVWNSTPKPSGHVGWICTKAGTPGVWNAFGQISV